GIYRLIKVISISEEGDIFTEQGYHFLVNRDIVWLLKNAESISFSLVTIGEKLEEIVRKKFDQNQSMQAIILDAIGTVAVKMVGQWFNHYLEKEISKIGYKLSRYFEPGSGDWDLEEQQKVFTILRPKEIGVSLSDHFMMIPTKSLSWMRGVGHHLVHSYRHEFSCRYCLLDHCQYGKKR
ncbi:MAG: hypothetical protein JXC36_04670, partial [Candidatus Atribacteria bacterium]|nr:hypothetical protein [Candidatus Atribacteria bacterium]